MEIVELSSSHHDQALVVAGKLHAWFGEVGLANVSVDIRHQRGLGAMRDGCFLGFVTWFVNEGSAYIGWLAVDPAYHRQGVGSALLGELRLLIHSYGLNRLRVWTLSETVDYEPYERTRAFYRSMGFKLWRHVPRYCMDGSDMEVYELALDI